MFKSIGSALGSLLKGIASIPKSCVSFLGGIFGGFRAGGGDVMPGKASIAGEKHPAFFLPKTAGQVVPSIQNNQRPIVYSPMFNISAPDVDSFRRSQGQITADFYRMMRVAHARS